MFLFKLISFLPLWVLYIFSDIFYLIGYHIVKYRQKVIFENLKFAFPEKSELERRKIAKKFYRNLTDSFAEIIKMYSISKKELNRRITIENYQIIPEAVEKGEVIIGLTGHFFNWELHLQHVIANVSNNLDVVYTKIKNPFFENLMFKIRTRFGGNMVEKDGFQRDYLRKRNQPRCIVLAADQRPNNREIRYWANFMNRETAFFEGAEKLTKKFNHPVFYSHISKPKRGHYHFKYEIIGTPPYVNSEEHSITDEFIKCLEENIRQYPELYLWSHDRWKWKKTNEN
ncbi:lysophospholipid acyltransferase family protein [Shivajiella indica]|uniref:Lysophospholipid acyltransferase family protein n=1 Tax=Shivajiella indica TaxID=872115 RepID=A0ABW5B8C8_9BACT